MSPLVVGLSGTSGAGKSALVEDLSERLHQRGIGLGTVRFDDFTDESNLSRGDVSGWLARVGQPSEWPADRMERHLRDVVAHHSEAEYGQVASVVLVEEPFGRARPGLGGLVDSRFISRCR